MESEPHEIGGAIFNRLLEETKRRIHIAYAGMHIRQLEWRDITAALLHALQRPKGVFASSGGSIRTGKPAQC
jgi:hypothetical protein